MFKYFSEKTFLAVLLIGCLCMLPAANAETLFTDNFSDGDLLPWEIATGTWTITGGVLQGSGDPNSYSYVYYSTTPQWTDYTVEGSIKIPAGSFGGGIGGRVDPATGTHYGAWVYPTGSAGGSNVLKLWKFQSGTNFGSGPMQQVDLPDVGHRLAHAQDDLLREPYPRLLRRESR